jgi:antitoxin component YwqK of YwqJK toxin-antitoxin module
VGDTSLREVTHYFKSGQLLERYWLRNGLREGEYKRYDNRGQLEQHVVYANGVYHGVWAAYEHGTKRIEAPFTHGKLDGWYYEYYCTGEVEVKCFYRAGRIVSGEMHYRADGTLAYEYIFNKDYNRLLMKSIYDKSGQHRLKLQPIPASKNKMPLTFYLFGTQAYE